MRGKVGQNMEGMKLKITKARKQHNVLSPSIWFGDPYGN